MNSTLRCAGRLLLVSPLALATYGLSLQISPGMTAWRGALSAARQVFLAVAGFDAFLPLLAAWILALGMLIVLSASGSRLFTLVDGGVGSEPLNPAPYPEKRERAARSPDR
jgi:hypothetical protein